MKRLMVLIFGMTLLLSACAVQGNQRPVEAITPVTQEATQVSTQPATQVPASTEVPPTPATVLPVPVTGAEEIEPAQNARVDVDGLNLRIGPGLNHRILGVLLLGQPVQAQGQSVDGQWINVRLADGREGWLFGAFLDADVDFADLPVLEAYGGPQEDQPQPTAAVNLPGRYTLYMTIVDNQATVSLTDFPANSQVSLNLAARSGSPSMTMANGWTDENGSAAITFDMPRYWPDGSRITQNDLTLVATSADGSVSRSASIVYYQGE